MRDDIKKALEEMTAEPHPGVRNQLRARLAAGRPRARHSMSPVVPALAAAAVVVGIVVSALLLGGRPPQAGVHSAPVAISPTPAPAATSTPSPPAQPSPIPTPTAGASLPSFQCSAQAGGRPATMPVTEIDVRVGTHPGYDRFVIQLNAPVPTWEVRPQASSTFTQDASGQQITLAGTRGILVLVHGAGPPSNGTWSQDVTGNPTIREARQIGNFESVFSWGLGVEGSGCFRAFLLDSVPNTLIVDVQSP